ncbi:imidazolonepropionase [Paraglaciecola polaris]|uniref:Imidazolonepropionase n=1 Tax=Paraglaciecola polaris LMG 21857 TaxID=1129793 RepID=K6ZUW7_9ALTE|nr:imidazolonepropionase [Paraglaciecola polaris]GAC32588.1 imidazolonepropionase [Paraglaciecola polaris LMG 21857]
MTKAADLLIRNVHIASMQDNGQPYGLIENACVAIKDGLISHIGSSQDENVRASAEFNGAGQWLLPGLIDCHTHLVFGGNRALEFEMRQQGKSYADIARQGGGIQSTVNATRAASSESLLQGALKRAARLVDEGVTTIEVKSGYGLDTDTEIKMLETAKEIEKHLGVNIITTYLGAHAVPIEYQDNPDEYVQLVCNELIPRIKQQGLASAVDVFCESIGFSPAQCEKVFIAAQKNGLHIKAHVEQLSDLKGAKLAAHYHALSVDHIEYLSSSDVPVLAKAGTVAMLLPGAFYSLRETQLPPIDALRQHKVPIALATDLNPGSSPIASLLTMLNMGCILFGLTPEEALFGVTKNAARALGLVNKGQIALGFTADLGLWDIEHPSQLSYGMNLVRPTRKWLAGQER